MKNIVRKFVGFAAAMGFALMAGGASASVLTIDQWYEFGFDGTAGGALGDCSGCTAGLLSVNIGQPAWTFDCPTDHCKIVITDGFLAVDRFQLFDNNVLIGTTSVPSGDANHSCFNDELACLADPQMSHGIFYVGQGAHSITGIQIAGIGGAGFLKVTVPEPGTLLLLGAGMLMALGLRRRA